MLVAILSIYISLISLINPLSAIPVFLSLTSNHSIDWIKKQVIKTTINVFVICVLSYLIGNYILSFFGISINSLKIAGGIIIARSGFQLLNAKHKKDISEKIKEESAKKEGISFTPLAMPLLSGPGSISFLINASLQREIYNTIFVLISIALVSLSIYFILAMAPKILSYVGQAGLKALSKIMGFIVLSIGIQLISNGVIAMITELK